MRTVSALPACAALAIAFGLGIAATPLLHDLIPDAHAQAPAASPATPAMTPTIIDVAAIRYEDLSGAPNADIRSKPYVVTDNATIGVQIGNVGKHYHAKSDEIQYIVEGSGTAWLGDRKVELRPGMMLVIPKGTNHAGTEATSGRFKAIAIKIPPQQSGDTTFVQ